MHGYASVSVIREIELRWCIPRSTHVKPRSTSHICISPGDVRQGGSPNSQIQSSARSTPRLQGLRALRSLQGLPTTKREMASVVRPSMSFPREKVQEQGHLTMRLDSPLTTGNHPRTQDPKSMKNLQILGSMATPNITRLCPIFTEE